MGSCGRVHDRAWAMSSTTLAYVFCASVFLVSGGSAESPPTWHSSIKTLVNVKCGECHRADGAAPFVLQSPDDFRKRRTFVGHVIQEQIMPPWLPSRGVPIVGSRALSKSDQDLLVAWLDAGCPVGELPKTPSDAEGASPQRPIADDSIGGNEGIVSVKMRSPWTVPAEGGRRWFKAERDKRTFVFPLENERSLRVRGIAYQSTAAQTLGAVALSVDPSGDGRRMVDWDDEPGSYMMADIRSVPAGSLAIIGPGGGRLQYPEGFYVPVPIGSDIMSQVHYRPQGRPRVLDDRVALETLDGGVPARPLVPVNLMVPRVELEPGERKEFSNELVLPVDIDLVALTPRASRRCISLHLEARVPGSDSPQVLLEIDDWNPHYRSTLILKEPLRLPAETIVSCRWLYDNSEQNPRNPVVPTEKVDLGSRSGAMNVLLMSAPVKRIEIRPLLDFIQEEAVRNRG